MLTPSDGGTIADDDVAAALVASAASAAANKAKIAKGQGKLITANDRSSFVYAVKAVTRPVALLPVPSGSVHQRAIFFRLLMYQMRGYWYLSQVHRCRISHTWLALRKAMAITGSSFARSFYHPLFCLMNVLSFR